MFDNVYLLCNKCVCVEGRDVTPVSLMWEKNVVRARIGDSSEKLAGARTENKYHIGWTTSHRGTG